MLDYGYAEHDAARIDLRRLEHPYQGTGGMEAARRLAGQQHFTARSGYPFSVFDCTNAATVCMRAVDAVDIDKNASDGPATNRTSTDADLAPIR
jgi:hypothetical protein